MDTLPIEYNDCWLWRGSLTSSGYGITTREGITQVAHRYVYRLLVSEIPNGLELDHLCKNILCVNPEHLEPVTRQENMRRRYASNLCKNGHKLEGDNLRVGKDSRRCKQCNNEYKRKYMQMYRCK